MIKITSLCGNKLSSLCNICLPKITGINTNIVIRNVHPVTTPKASGLNQNNFETNDIILILYILKLHKICIKII